MTTPQSIRWGSLTGQRSGATIQARKGHTGGSHWQTRRRVQVYRPHPRYVDQLTKLIGQMDAFSGFFGNRD